MLNKVVLSSEISGSVWKIKCNVGDVIEEGQEVLIIESMKMEIPVISDFSGTVISILVDEGEMINEDQKLVELHKKD
ncbi:MAG: acetyl-CoA carboxylase biotin carboxyl carrier protein subunit [Alphaproteobacteria bacterium]|nr:MAG: acetyl-CoA carboxylase biotin carboxyl carrier protein subunit [Alphaproteobacteria bacterium]